MLKKNYLLEVIPGLYIITTPITKDNTDQEEMIRDVLELIEQHKNQEFYYRFIKSTTSTEIDKKAYEELVQFLKEEFLECKPGYIERQQLGSNRQWNNLYKPNLKEEEFFIRREVFKTETERYLTLTPRGPWYRIQLGVLAKQNPKKESKLKTINKIYPT